MISWLLWFYSQWLENVSGRLIWFSVCLIKITFAARKVFCNVFKHLWNHKQNISDYFSFTFEINNILLSFSKSVWTINQNHSVFYFIYFWNQYRMFFWPNTLNYSINILCLHMNAVNPIIFTFDYSQRSLLFLEKKSECSD